MANITQLSSITSSFATAKPGPNTPSDEMTAMSKDWPMIEALLGGTSAMRAAGQTFLPIQPAEDGDAYGYRLKVSTLFNGFRRTVDTMSAKPFNEELKLSDDTDEQVIEWTKDIDLQGRSLQAFGHDVLKSAMSYGLSHILVDYPETTPGQSLADHRASGARPYFVHIKPDQILGWRAKRINGVETLIQLRIMEVVSEDDGPWATKAVEQVRVIEPTQFQIYRKDAKSGEWVIYREGKVSLGAIPLVTIYGSQQDFMIAEPPLLDLAFLNVEHWQNSSDQQNILRVARVPILFGAGMGDTPIVVGAGTAVTSDMPDAKLTYVEHTGKAIEAGRESLKDLEDRMSLMGAQLLVRKPVQVTATEKSLDSAEADSALTRMAIEAQISFAKALKFAAQWESIEYKGTVGICTDFDDGFANMSVTDLLRARELGILSAETVFAEMQRRDIISESATWEDEQSRIKGEGPVAGIIGSFETSVKADAASNAPA